MNAEVVPLGVPTRTALSTSGCRRSVHVTRRTVSPIVMLILTCLLAQPAAAVEYFVGVDHPNASDSNSGLSPDQPFETISRGAQGLGPGDTLTIMAGVYREVIVIPGSGTQADPMLIRAYPGHEGYVVIRGSDVIVGWTGDGGNVWSVPWNPLPLINYPPGFPDYGEYSRRREMVFVDGSPLEQVMSAGELGTGRFWMDDASGRLRMYHAGDPNSRQVEISVRTRGLVAYGGNVVFRGLRVEHVTTGIYDGAMHLGTRHRVEDCTVEYNNGHGIVALSEFEFIRSSSNHNGRIGVTLTGDNAYLDSSETSYNSWRYGPMWDAGGVKVCGNDPPTGNRVVGHTARYNNGPGVWFDTVGAENVVEASFLEGNVLAGVDLEAAAGPNWIINNVIVGTFKTPDNYWGFDGTGILLYETMNTNILNNTIVDVEGYGLAIFGGQRGPYHCAGTGFYNNIIVGSGESAIHVAVTDLSRQESNVASHHFDNNLYHGNPTVIVFPDTSTPYNMYYWSLAEWQANRSEDLDSLSLPPDFVNPGNHNFSPLPDSPLVDAGEDLVEVHDDFVGCRRPKGAHTDIGAYEYCLEPGSPPVPGPVAPPIPGPVAPPSSGPIIGPGLNDAGEDVP